MKNRLATAVAMAYDAALYEVLGSPHAEEVMDAYDRIVRDLLAGDSANDADGNKVFLKDGEEYADFYDTTLNRVMTENQGYNQ